MSIMTGVQAGGVTFDRVSVNKLRVQFENKDKAKSGVTEVEVWKE